MTPPPDVMAAPLGPFRAVHQILGALSAGDAVGNEALQFRIAFRDLGYRSDIFAGWRAPGRAHEALSLDRLKAEAASQAAAESAWVLHYTLAGPALDAALATAGPLLLRYHNVTPPEFFAPFDGALARQCIEARRRLLDLKDRTAVALAPSRFNATELKRLGYRRVETLPLALDVSLYAESVTSPVLEKRFRDGRRNVLFVGRVVPNKKIENLIRAFAVYQRYAEPRSRLVIAGALDGFAYSRRLRELVDELRIEEVVFMGRLTQAELNACYRTASVFAFLSEHEGYGAPLVEAMRFSVPVIALDRGAVRETLQGGGALISEPDIEVVAETIDALTVEPLRSAVLGSQAKALSRIQSVDVRAALRRVIDSLSRRELA